MALFQPAPLQKGDRVALIAPSGPLPEGRLPLALDAIRARGLEPVAYPASHKRTAILRVRTRFARRTSTMPLQTIRSRACSAPAAVTARNGFIRALIGKISVAIPSAFWDTATSRFSI